MYPQNKDDIWYVKDVLDPLKQLNGESGAASVQFIYNKDQRMVAFFEHRAA